VDPILSRPVDKAFGRTEAAVEISPSPAIATAAYQDGVRLLEFREHSTPAVPRPP
jgi:hypothetical protein